MNDATMPLTAHLEELRWRLIRAFAAIAVAFAVCYGFSDRIFTILTQPLLGAGDQQLLLIGTGVTEAFFTRLKVTFIAAIFAASPVIFYQAWRFVAPGLYANERRTAIPFVFAGTFFFVAGAVFCYFLVFLFTIHSLFFCTIDPPTYLLNLDLLNNTLIEIAAPTPHAKSSTPFFLPI